MLPWRIEFYPLSIWKLLPPLIQIHPWILVPWKELVFRFYGHSIKSINRGILSWYKASQKTYHDLELTIIKLEHFLTVLCNPFKWHKTLQICFPFDMNAFWLPTPCGGAALGIKIGCLFLVLLLFPTFIISLPFLLLFSFASKNSLQFTLLSIDIAHYQHYSALALLSIGIA